MALTVIGGGRRCGKTRYSLALASARGPRLAYVATLQADDEENTAKIEAARAERGPGILTVEEPLAVARRVEELSSSCDAIVLDDLTVWVSNMVMARRGIEVIEGDAARLVEAATHGSAELIIVTSDVDFGFAVDGPESRRFRRLAGLINRQMAEASARLYWMVFGTPQRVR